MLAERLVEATRETFALSFRPAHLRQEDMPSCPQRRTPNSLLQTLDGFSRAARGSKRGDEAFDDVGLVGGDRHRSCEFVNARQSGLEPRSRIAVHDDRLVWRQP